MRFLENRITLIITKNEDYIDLNEHIQNINMAI
jgi:hypothetical protein